MECKFVIPGKPVGKARPRVTRRKTKTGKTFTQTYTPEKTVLYENWVKECFLNQCKDWKPEDTEYRAVIVAEFPIPKSKPKREKAMMISLMKNPTGKPDVDNVAKAVLDSLNGLAYPDDSHVVSLFIKKIYSDDPKVTVYINKKE